jgi:hypothetical protein
VVHLSDPPQHWRAFSSYYSGILASPEIYLTRSSLVSFDGVVLRVVRCSEVAWTLVHMLSQFPTIIELGDLDAPLFSRENLPCPESSVRGHNRMHLLPPPQLCHEPSVKFDNDD